MQHRVSNQYQCSGEWGVGCSHNMCHKADESVWCGHLISSSQSQKCWNAATGASFLLRIAGRHLRPGAPHPRPLPRRVGRGLVLLSRAAGHQPQVRPFDIGYKTCSSYPDGWCSPGTFWWRPPSSSPPACCYSGRQGGTRAGLSPQNSSTRSTRLIFSSGQSNKQQY